MENYLEAKGLVASATAPASAEAKAETGTGWNFTLRELAIIAAWAQRQSFAAQLMLEEEEARVIEVKCRHAIAENTAAPPCARCADAEGLAKVIDDLATWFQTYARVLHNDSVVQNRMEDFSHHGGFSECTSPACVRDRALIARARAYDAKQGGAR